MPYFDQYGPNFDQSGGNAARDYGQYSGSDDFRKNPPANLQAILSRLFGRGQPQGSIQQQPLPPPPGTTQTGGPFGGPGGPYDPSQQQPNKPVSQLASAQTIADRINKMVGQPQESAPPDWQSFFPPVQPNQMPPFQSSGSPMPQQGMPNSTAQAAGQSPFDYFHMGIPKNQQRHRVDMRTAQRADGGPIPGFMRGGYPELYNAPVRHAFDSGGESYVDHGEGGGRADNINARLSPREYVMDAETMALLGDGNPDEGAKKMDTLRSNIRKHKGKELAKGKISPNAKSAASSYIAGSPMSAGLNRVSVKA